MRTTLVALAEAAAQAAKPAQRTAQQAGRRTSSGKQHNWDTSSYLLVEVPRTALATDVQRALKEVEAVSRGYPLSAINARPIGAKRSPSLTTTYHLSFSSPEQANKAHTLISQRPLFAAAGTRATPARSQDHLGLRLDDRGTPRVMFIASPAEEWAERSLARAAREGVRPKLAGAESTSDHIGVQWALDRGSRNRRVLITGLPFRATPAEVNKLASGVGELAEVACRQVPHAAWSNTSAWAVTAASVAQAYQIARKLNRNYFAQEKWGTRYLMRAHVHP